MEVEVETFQNMNLLISLCSSAGLISGALVYGLG